MTSTLIIRDATLAINGASVDRSDPRAHLRARVEEVRGFQDDFLADSLEVLMPSAQGEGADMEALEALLIVGAARPELASARGVSTISAGRQLAHRLEKEDQGEKALAALELLVELFPGHKALERDLAGFMRRAGLVSDLVERYLQRSQQLLRQGRTAEAIAWMREVLLLDRSRKDVARTIRDLRFQEIDRVEARRSRRRVAVIALVGSLAISVGLLRETRLAEEFRALPGAEAGDSAGMRERLAALEAFVERHPIWHGAFRALSERTELRLACDRALEAERLAQERRAAELARRADEAELARERGTLLARDGQYAIALDELRHALELSRPDWEHRERVQEDIAAISAYLEDHP